MRRFKLVRNEDVSGVSGTGVVAEGIEWTNGNVSVCWLGTFFTIETAANIHTIERIHGHGGRTRIEWVDPDEV